MTERYPDIEPYASGLLEVGDGQEVYWEAVGNHDGLPALYLHGGPGSGCTAGARRSFDPNAYRVVLFDQRGCGRSRPLADHAGADLSSNTTGHLLADIEALRRRLGIERWIVVGGSWGVTLGLAYAERHPERVLAMVLAAVTSGRRLETDWITRDMRRVFPREWDEFAAGVPLPAGLRPAGHALLEQRLLPADGEIAANLHRIASIPVVLIHGRYDVSGPLDTAWELHRAWPASAWSCSTRPVTAART